jgi:DNA replication protein DnaC
MGDLLFCDCPAGVAYRAWCTRMDNGFVDDDALAEQLRQAAIQHRQKQLFAEAGIPPAYAVLSFRDYKALAAGDPGKIAAIQAIVSHFETGRVSTADGEKRGILLWGDSGVGKTGALTPLFRHYIEQGYSGLWINYADLMHSLKRFEDGQVHDRFEACKHVEHLLLDDLFDPAAERGMTDYERSALFRIIEHRKSYFKPTFVTSNVSLEHIAEDAHARVARRLAEMCAIIHVGGQPLRQVKLPAF